MILIHSSDLHSLLQSNLYRPQHNTSNADDDIFFFFTPAVNHTTREFVLPHLFVDGGGEESLQTDIVLSETQVRLQIAFYVLACMMLWVVHEIKILSLK